MGSNNRSNPLFSVDVSFTNDGTVEMEAVGGTVASVTFTVDDITVDTANITRIDEPVSVTIESAVENERIGLYDEEVAIDEPNESLGFDDIFESDEAAEFDLVAADHHGAAVFNAEREGGQGEFTDHTAVEMIVTVSHMDIAVSDSAAFTVSVTNPYDEITMKVGFVEGQFTDPEEADGALFMTDGEEPPAPVDIDVAAFDSVTVTINGAGGAEGATEGGAGGRIAANADLSGIDTLRVWAGENPEEERGAFGANGGFGRFDGGAGDDGSGGGGGSTHVSDADVVDDDPDEAASIAIADAGGGGGDHGLIGIGASDGGGGARGGAGENPAEGAGFGGDGGGAVLGTVAYSGDDGGQQAGDTTDVDIIDEETGGGNSGHADVTLELTTDGFDG